MVQMQKINIHEAKTNLSKLVDQAANGESFIVAKAGKPMAKLVPLDEEAKKGVRYGFMKGEIKSPDNFNRMGDEEILNLFGIDP